MKLKKLNNEKDKSTIEFLIAVLPYIVQELYDLTGDKYYDDEEGNSSWMMLRNIICEGLNSINSK